MKLLWLMSCSQVGDECGVIEDRVGGQEQAVPQCQGVASDGVLNSVV